MKPVDRIVRGQNYNKVLVRYDGVNELTYYSHHDQAQASSSVYNMKVQEINLMLTFVLRALQ